MELLQLKYFLELAEQQHLTRVAEKLYVSPSAISSSIARLESELGVKLFNRIGRSIELNEYGKLYFPYVKKALEGLDDGKKNLEDLRNNHNQYLTLVMTNPYIWQRVLDVFGREHPEIHFTHYLFDPIAVGHKVPNQDVDLIIASPDGFKDSAWNYTVLFEDRVALAVPPGHPFSDRDSIKLEEAKDEWFVNLSESTFSDFCTKLCQCAGFTPKSRVTCDYMLRPDIAYREGMVALTTYNAVKAGIFQKMNIIPLSDAAAIRPQAIFYPKDRYLPTSAKLLKDYLIEFYHDYDPFN